MRGRPEVMLLLGACTPETALLLHFAPDKEVAARLEEIGVFAWVDGKSVGDRLIAVEGEPPTLSLRPGDLPDDATIRVGAVAHLDDDHVVVRIADVAFAPGEDRDACIWFDIFCKGLVCEPDDCRAGGCVAPAFLPADCIATSCAGAEDCSDLTAATEDWCDEGQCRHVQIASPAVPCDSAYCCEGDDRLICADEDAPTCLPYGQCKALCEGPCCVPPCASGKDQ